MDFNIILWLGGILFSLSIFVVKVGFGLAYGRVGWRGTVLTLALYWGLFILTACFAEGLIKMLEPVLQTGPYLHIFMALALIGWGIYLIFRIEPDAKNQDRSCGLNKATGQETTVSLSTIFLVLPCPVCLTAMTFSSWAAFKAIKLPAPAVGAGLGSIFIILTLLIILALKTISPNLSPFDQKIALSLSLMGLGLYFPASLFLPAKIEEARGIYQSFLTEGSNIALSDYLGVLLILLTALVIGFLTTKRGEIKA